MSRRVHPPNRRGVSVLMLAVHVREVTVYTDNFCRSFADRNEVSICSYYPPEFEFDRPVRVFAGDGTVRGYLRALGRALDEQSVDVVHSHYPHTGVLWTLFKRLQRGRALPPMLQTVQNKFANYRLRNRLMWHLVYPVVDCICHCGDASRASFPKWLRALGKRAPVSIPNAVDFEYLDAALSCATTKAKSTPGLTFVYCGRLIACKNVGALIRAFGKAQSGNARLRIVGDGAQRSGLERLAQQHCRPGQVEFTGAAPLAEAYRYMAAADAVVHPSLAEGLPRSVLEAMACRTPVLLSDIPPHREIGGDADCVEYFEPTDEASLVRLIDAVCDMPEEERTLRGEACRELVRQRFSVATMHDRYQSLYEELIEAGAAPQARKAA